MVLNFDGRKIEIDWQPEGDLPRGEIKLAFLVLQCFESTMPWGGYVRVSRKDSQWQILGEAEKLKIEPKLWDLLSTSDEGGEVPPAHVHFALIAPELARQGRLVGVTISDHSINVTF